MTFSLHILCLHQLDFQVNSFYSVTWNVINVCEHFSTVVSNKKKYFFILSEKVDQIFRHNTQIIIFSFSFLYYFSILTNDTNECIWCLQKTIVLQKNTYGCKVMVILFFGQKLWRSSSRHCFFHGNFTRYRGLIGLRGNISQIVKNLENSWIPLKICVMWHR